MKNLIPKMKRIIKMILKMLNPKTPLQNLTKKLNLKQFLRKRRNMKLKKTKLNLTRKLNLKRKTKRPLKKQIKQLTCKLKSQLTLLKPRQ
jgi:hypothetical protein